MLRHDNDGEANSKITIKALRAVKIEGLNFNSKKSFLVPIGFQGLSKAQPTLPIYSKAGRQ
jgi:hypothetical protein